MITWIPGEWRCCCSAPLWLACLCHSYVLRVCKSPARSAPHLITYKCFVRHDEALPLVSGWDKQEFNVLALWSCLHQIQTSMELSHFVQHVAWTVDPKIAVFILLGSPLFKIRIILPHYIVAYTTCINTPLFVFWLESDHLIGGVPGLRLVPQNPVQSS